MRGLAESTLGSAAPRTPSLPVASPGPLRGPSRPPGGLFRSALAHCQPEWPHPAPRATGSRPTGPRLRRLEQRPGKQPCQWAATRPCARWPSSLPAACTGTDTGTDRAPASGSAVQVELPQWHNIVMVPVRLNRRQTERLGPASGLRTQRGKPIERTLRLPLSTTTNVQLMSPNSSHQTGAVVAHTDQPIRVTRASQPLRLILHMNDNCA